MQSKLSDFWTKHRFLIICAAAYVIVFIVSCFYNPWDMKWQIGNKTIISESNAVESYVRSVHIDNRFLDKIPLTFLGFGFADVAECVHNDVGILCGFIAYAAVLVDYLVKKYYESREDAKKFEIFVSSYLCDNIIFYIMSVLVNLFIDIDFNSERFHLNMEPWSIAGSKIGVAIGLIFVIALIILLIILLIVFCFIIVPMFLFAVPPTAVTYIYFFAYLIVYRLCTDLIEAVNGKIMQNGESLLLELIIFILASLIILALNLLLSKIFEIIRDWSIKPAKVYVNLIRKAVQKFRSRR